MTDYLHGIEVIEVSDPPAMRSVDSSIIGLVGTLEETSAVKSIQKSVRLIEANKDDTDKLYLLNSLEDFEKEFESSKYKTGTLYPALLDIFSQAPSAKIVLSVMKDKTDQDRAIKLFLNATCEVYVTPKILIAPELDTSLEDVVTSAKQLVSVAKELRAVAIVDLIKDPETTDTVFMASLKTAKMEPSDRLYLVYPKIMAERLMPEKSNVEEVEELNVIDTNKTLAPSKPITNIDKKKEEKLELQTIARPASTFVAALIVKSDRERGFWHSPSNYAFTNIKGTSTSIPFLLGNKDCLANQLNEKTINTIIWYDSYRLWGNKSYAEGQYKFLSVRRIADTINESVLRSHMWAIDKNITSNFKDTVIDSVNAYLRKLKMQGAIINGKCWANEKANTKESLIDGTFHFCFDFTPPYPAERIVFTGILTNQYIEEVLS